MFPFRAVSGYPDENIFLTTDRSNGSQRPRSSKVFPIDEFLTDRASCVDNE